MQSARLPGGGKAWFVRHGNGRFCNLKPASVEGRLLTGLFAAVVTAISAYFVSNDPDAVEIGAWIVLTFTATFLYIVTAVRMSAADRTQGRTRCF